MCRRSYWAQLIGLSAWLPRVLRIELEKVMDFAPVSLSGTSESHVKAALSQNHNFMLRVQAAIGPKFLDGQGQEGRVMVAFSISGTGQLLGVRLAQSSGIDKLDALAMQIVGKANFPAPPTGMGVVHRTFVSAFNFG